jgi:hypothetical protein
LNACFILKSSTQSLRDAKYDSKQYGGFSS